MRDKQKKAPKGEKRTRCLGKRDCSKKPTKIKWRQWYYLGSREATALATPRPAADRLPHPTGDGRAGKEGVSGFERGDLSELLNAKPSKEAKGRRKMDETNKIGGGEGEMGEGRRQAPIGYGDQGRVQREGEALWALFLRGGIACRF